MPCQKARDELGELHREFLDLSTSVEELVAGAVRTIRAPDPDRLPPAGAGAALAERRCRITERCQRILLLYQPVAGDFREVTAVLRMSSELEHIGNLADEISGREAVLATLPVSVPDELDRMAGIVSGMVRRAADAYVLLDAGPVCPVDWTRTEVSALARVLMDWLTGVVRADPGAVESELVLCAVIQNLKRIAEHAAVLAEEVTFLTARSAGADTPAAAAAGW
jgi:phosphate transport system protein